jgi:hypothetical protein
MLQGGLRGMLRLRPRAQKEDVRMGLFLTTRPLSFQVGQPDDATEALVEK